MEFLRHPTSLQTALRAYTYCHHPQVIFIHEVFVGGTHLKDLESSLIGYISYVHHTRNGLIHSTMLHQLIRGSVSVDITFQLFEVTVGDG